MKKTSRNQNLTKASIDLHLITCLLALVAAEKSDIDMSDFGKNVIPTYLERMKVLKQEFNGYWKTL